MNPIEEWSTKFKLLMLPFEEWAEIYEHLINALPQSADPIIRETLNTLHHLERNYITYHSSSGTIDKISLLTSIETIVQSLLDMEEIRSHKPIYAPLKALMGSTHDQKLINIQSVFTQMTKAIQDNDLGVARKILDQALESQKTTELPQDLLQYFLEKPEENEALIFINLLAEKKFDFNCDIGDTTPCIIACDAVNAQSKLTALIAAGADINKTNLEDGISPLSHASSERNTDLIDYLLQQGAAPDIDPAILFDIAKGSWPCTYFNTIDRETKLRRDLETMGLFIKSGISVNQNFEHRKGKQRSVLQGALRGGRYEMVKLLLESDAKPYENMMEDAIKSGNIKMVSMLLKELKSHNITLPKEIPGDLDLDMFQACFKNGLGLANYNLTDHVVLNTPDALLVCIQRGDSLSSDCEINPYNEIMPTICSLYMGYNAVCESLPLAQYLAAYGKAESLAHVIEASADVYMSDTNGSTLLHYAAAECNIETVKMLILVGADVNTQNSKGDTPLHCLLIGARYHASSQETALTCAEVLLYNGADLDLSNNDKKKPLNRCNRYWADALANMKPRANHTPISITTVGVPTLFNIAASQLAIHPQLASNLAHRKVLPLKVAKKAEKLSLMLLAPPKHRSSQEVVAPEGDIVAPEM
ncbi:MAG: ankyrin repeat domain-containing protein [Gammaproteobacteria bacterium]|nr:ankyrin repeat domain-containing protein [Gammaproteobacteria bacterium]